MSAEIIETSNGVVTCRVSGLLKQAELEKSQKEAGEILRRLGKGRFLVLIEDFEGTEKGGDWGDVSFQMEFDRYIEKIAIVGDKKWEGTTYLFTGKGIRKMPIEYFEPGDIEKANAWLREGDPKTHD